MSLIAARGAALTAPLPADLPAMATVSDASLALASASANAQAVAPVAAGASHATDTAADAAAVPQQATQKSAARTPANVAPAKDEVGTQSPASARIATFPTNKTATVAQIGKPAAMPHAPSAAGSIGSTFFALIMVIGLILALAWLAKRMPGLRGGAGNSALRIVGSLSLSPRERLVVVAVGETQLVLGVGTGGTRTLHTLSEPLPVAAPAAMPALDMSKFAQVLSQHFGKKA